MIELRLKRTALRLDFSFAAVLALFFWQDDNGFGLITLLLCAAHELAHLAVMLVCGIIPQSITFYGAGIRISAPEVDCCGTEVITAVYSAGCVMNFVIAAAAFGCGCCETGAVSFFMGCFNLLPIGEFDGRRLLRQLIISYAAPEHVDSILFYCGLASAVACSSAIIIWGRGASPTLLITAVYLIVMSVRRV